MDHDEKVIKADIDQGPSVRSSLQRCFIGSQQLALRVSISSLVELLFLSNFKFWSNHLFLLNLLLLSKLLFLSNLLSYNSRLYSAVQEERNLLIITRAIIGIRTCYHSDI
jgi:hypothetical protein